MKLSVCARTFRDKSLSEALDNLKSMNVYAAEIGSGGYVGKDHCNPNALLWDDKMFHAFQDLFCSKGMEISCLSVHCNPVHPRKEIAMQHHRDLIEAIDLAAKLGVKTVVTLSGCPGDSDDALYPNWCFYPWPLENTDLVKYQWEKKLVPYWKQTGAYAADKGVNIALELQGAVCVYSPATLFRLREETGQRSIGANVDPSHLWWQGIDPAMAIRILAKEDCIYHFHAKDMRIDAYNADANGVLDSQNFSQTRERAWLFCTIGYGHGMQEWAKIISTLRAVGYDGYISVEHEDALMSQMEGLKRGIENIATVIMDEPAVLPPAFVKKT